MHGPLVEQTVGWPNDEQLAAMQAIATRSWLLGVPVNSEATVGELAWAHRRELADNEWLLIYEGGDLLAWGRLSPTERIRVSTEREALSDASLAWQTGPAHRELLARIVHWAADRAHPLQTTVRAEDAAALELLAGRIAPIPDAPWSAYNVRGLEAIEPPVVPEGFRLTTYADTRDDARRIEVHRASWESTTFSQESFDRLRRTWPYREDLDVLVVAPDGTHVASVLAWFDERAGLGEFEPVGTHPAFRQQGLARAANLFAMQRLKSLGATLVAVACRGDDAYPIPARLYASVGFRRLYRDVPVRLTT